MQKFVNCLDYQDTFTGFFLFQLVDFNHNLFEFMIYLIKQKVSFGGYSYACFAIFLFNIKFRNNHVIRWPSEETFKRK